MTNKLTKEDEWFLVRLRHELRRQNNDSTADPVYWQVQQEEKIDSSDGQAYGYQIVWHDGDFVEFDTVEEIIEYLNDQDHDDESVDELVEELNGLDNDDLDEAISCIQFSSIDNKDEWDIYAYKKEQVIKNGPIFLTKEEAKQHIRNNRHHYNDTVHTWGAYAWRSPSFEALITLLKSDKIIASSLLTELYELYCSYVPNTKKLPINNPDDVLNVLSSKTKNALNRVPVEIRTKNKNDVLNYLRENTHLDTKEENNIEWFLDTIESLSDQYESCVKPQ